MSTNHVKLLFILVLYSICSLVASTFTNFYVWQTTQAFNLVVFYNTLTFIGIGVIGGLTVIIGNKFPAKMLYQIAMVLYIMQLLYVIWVKDSIGGAIVPLGLIQGCAMGLQAISINTIIQSYTNGENRSYFLGTMTVILSVVGILVTPIVSFGIDHVGYIPLFMMAIALFLGIILLVVRLPVTNIVPSHSLRETFAIIRENQDLRILLRSKFLFGIQNGLFWLSLSIITLTFVGSLTKWGIFSSILTTLSIIIAYFYSRTAKASFQKYIAIVVTLIFAISSVLLAVYWNLPNFIAYQIMQVFLGVMMGVGFESYYGSILDENDQIASVRLPINGISEIYILAGRLIPAIFLLLLDVDTENILYLQIAYIFVSFIPLQIISTLNRAQAVKQATA